MNIEFKRLDEKIPLIEDAAKEIIDCVLNGNEEIFIVFANTLLDCHKYIANTFVNDKIVKKIDKYKMLYSQISEELEHLKNLLWDYFSNIEDFRWDSLLHINSNYYKNINAEQKKLDKLRGILFEVLVETIIRPRCIRENFETGCVVIINGEEVVSYHNDKARRTIDIATHQGGYGEFYECKLSPKVFGIEAYKYLNLLENKLSRIYGFNSLVACTTLGDKLALENAKIKIEESLEIHNANIMLFGRDEILLLKESPFKEAI